MRRWRAMLTPHRTRQLWYVPWLGVAMALMLARTLVIARILDVRGFGEFSAGLLVSNMFGMLGCVGAYSLLQRDLPIMIARNRARRGALRLMQAIAIAYACATLCLLLVIAGMPLAGLSRLTLLVALVHGLAQQLFLIVTLESRSRGQPLRFAQQNLLRSAGVFGLGIIAASQTHSALWTLVAEAAVSIILAQATLGAILRSVALNAAAAFRLALRRLPRMQWRAAVTLLMVSVVTFLLMNADRWIAAQWLKSEQFAQYAFAWTVLLIGQATQSLVSAAAYPMLARRYALFGRQSAYRACTLVSGGLLIGGAVCAVPAWAIVTFAITRWFPAYASALDLVPLFIAVAVLRVSDMWSGFLVIVGVEARLLALNLCAIVLAGMLWLASAQPWKHAVGAWELGILAAFLSLTNYGLTAIAAWQVHGRKGEYSYER
jgi:O-antigen/teichoic acid export membrane protein